MLIRHLTCCRNYCVTIAMIIMLQGCVDLTLQRSQLSESISPTTKKQEKVAGHIYTMRGFLGIFSRGMDSLADRCHKEIGVATLSVAAKDWRELARFIIEQKQKNNLTGPLILVGHSEGADNQIDVAYKLADAKIPVDLLVLVGPFAPRPVPNNVKYVFTFDRSYEVGKIIPFMGNVTVRLEDPRKTTMETLDIGYTPTPFNTYVINHFNIDKNRDAQNIVLAKIRQFVG